MERHLPGRGPDPGKDRSPGCPRWHGCQKSACKAASTRNLLQRGRRPVLEFRMVGLPRLQIFEPVRNPVKAPADRPHPRPPQPLFRANGPASSHPPAPPHQSQRPTRIPSQRPGPHTEVDSARKLRRSYGNEPVAQATGLRRQEDRAPEERRPPDPRSIAGSNPPSPETPTGFWTAALQRRFGEAFQCEPNRRQGIASLPPPMNRRTPPPRRPERDLRSASRRSPARPHPRPTASPEPKARPHPSVVRLTDGP
jgi:hypothetical protein